MAGDDAGQIDDASRADAERDGRGGRGTGARPRHRGHRPRRRPGALDRRGAARRGRPGQRECDRRRIPRARRARLGAAGQRLARAPPARRPAGGDRPLAQGGQGAKREAPGARPRGGVSAGRRLADAARPAAAPALQAQPDVETTSSTRTRIGGHEAPNPSWRCPKNRIRAQHPTNVPMTVVKLMCRSATACRRSRGTRSRHTPSARWRGVRHRATFPGTRVGVGAGTEDIVPNVQARQTAAGASAAQSCGRDAPQDRVLGLRGPARLHPRRLPGGAGCARSRPGRAGRK